MQAIESVLSLIATLGVLVTIHEYGHYWVARRCGVKVLRFSIGFGKPLLTWHNKLGTEFCIALIPLGGYVKMLDEREGQVPAEELAQAFNQKSVWQRISIAAAGPVANFLFAIVAYWLMFLVGFNVLVPKVGSIFVDSPAYEANLRAGDEVVSFNGDRVHGWRDLNMSLVSHIGESSEASIGVLDSSGNESVKKVVFEEWLVDSEPKDLIAAFGIERSRPAVRPVVDLVVTDGAAYLAGLKKGDEFLAIESQSVNDWFEVVDVIQRSAGLLLSITVKNEQGDVRALNIIPEDFTTPEGKKVGRIGVQVKPFSYPPEMIREVSYSPFDSFVLGMNEVWKNTLMTLGAVKKMVTGQLSLDNLSGPITIAQVASVSISSGLQDTLSFWALLSISLGVLNLLPIPVLDGGHILYYLAEAVRGKPLPESWQVLGLKIGLAMVFLLMTVALYNDFMRL